MKQHVGKRMCNQRGLEQLPFRHQSSSDKMCTSDHVLLDLLHEHTCIFVWLTSHESMYIINVSKIDNSF